MFSRRRLGTRDVAVVASFAALYALLSLIPLSPIIGLPGRAITVAAIMAPLIGVILGAYTGALSALLGGSIVLWTGFLSPPSFVSGILAAFCAGLLRNKRHVACALTYSSLLFIFSLYPAVGPVWLYPPLLWFQVAGLILLVSPIQVVASRRLSSNPQQGIFSALLATCLTSTLAGQIAGSLAFEAISFPALLADEEAWRATWQTITFLYPLERIIIAVGAALIGTPLLKTLGRTIPRPTTSSKADANPLGHPAKGQ